jgi:hypothetical protein
MKFLRQWGDKTMQHLGNIVKDKAAQARLRWYDAADLSRNTNPRGRRIHRSERLIYPKKPGECPHCRSLPVAVSVVGAWHSIEGPTQDRQAAFARLLNCWVYFVDGMQCRSNNKTPEDLSPTTCGHALMQTLSLSSRVACTADAATRTDSQGRHKSFNVGKMSAHRTLCHPSGAAPSQCQA